MSQQVEVSSYKLSRNLSVNLYTELLLLVNLAVWTQWRSSTGNVTLHKAIATSQLSTLKTPAKVLNYPPKTTVMASPVT